MHKLTIKTLTNEYTRTVDTFARAMELARETTTRGYTHEEPDAFVFIPPQAITSVRIEQIVDEKPDERKQEGQRSEVSKGQQRKRRG